MDGEVAGGGTWKGKIAGSSLALICEEINENRDKKCL